MEAKLLEHIKEQLKIFAHKSRKLNPNHEADDIEDR
ncbi:MAG: hypothetical protein BWY95_01652 [Bacteroidetes bacterium ADurb.BinA104]|nr:MAG: hypothetical protein BWY95_01652 [Bacteroidetes bacterium ADurb.BinA104]